jgi:hypothetical protein
MWRQLFDDHGNRATVQSLIEKLMAIAILPPHSHKQRTWDHLSGIGHNLLNGTTRGTEEDVSRQGGEKIC